MINKEALDLLRSLVLAASRVEHTDEAIVLPKDCALQDLDYLHPTARRYAGTYKTGSIEDFCAYIEAQASTARPVVFVSMIALVAEAIFDLGTVDAPGHRVHRARLELRETAEWRAAAGEWRCEYSQKDFIEWIGDWAQRLTFYNADGAAVDAAAAAAIFRQITVETLASATSKIEAHHERRTALEDVEAKSSAAIPQRLLFDARRALGLPTVQVPQRIEVGAGDKGLRIVTRCTVLESVIEAVQNHFSNDLRNVLGDSCAVYFGGFER